jgi:hypothetical protein
MSARPDGWRKLPAEEVLARLFEHLPVPHKDEPAWCIVPEVWRRGEEGMPYEEALSYIDPDSRSRSVRAIQLLIRGEVLTYDKVPGLLWLSAGLQRPEDGKDGRSVWGCTRIREAIVRAQAEFAVIDSLAKTRAGLGQALDPPSLPAPAESPSRIDRVLEIERYPSRISIEIDEAMEKLKGTCRGQAVSSLQQKLAESRPLAAIANEVRIGETLLARNFAIWQEQDPGWLDGKLSEAKEKRNPIAWLNTVLDREFRVRKEESAKSEEAGV